MTTEPRKKSAWVVFGADEYDGGHDTYGIFFDYKAACLFQQKCRDHDEKMPDYPDECEDLEKYEKAISRWKKRHPAGKYFEYRRDFIGIHKTIIRDHQ